MVTGLYQRMDPHEFTATVADLEIGVTLLNLKGHLTYFNDAAVKIVGASSRREMVGRKFGPETPHDRYVTRDGATLERSECPVCVALTGGGVRSGVFGRLDARSISWQYLTARPRHDAPGALVTFHLIK